MNSKRVREWLGTANGLVKSVVALVGVLATIFAATTKAFEPVVDVPMAPSWASPAVAVILIALLGLWLERSFRRFAQASRLERPDAFRLRPTNPASLMGRNEDLVRLITCVKHKRLVLMDGESGCGKSALVSAGLVPSLRQSDGLLPIAIRDWGDDWVRGPLSAAVEAIFHAVSQTERDRLAWTSSPDLAADTDALVADLDARLKAVVRALFHDAVRFSIFLSESPSIFTRVPTQGSSDRVDSWRRTPRMPRQGILEHGFGVTPARPCQTRRGVLS